MIWIALAFGAAAATAALYGHYRVLPGWLTGPEVCLMEDGGCAVLFRSPRSRLLGVPNALLGVILYVLLASGLLLHWPGWLLFVMTLPAVAMSLVLACSLIARKLQCRICWTGHVANAVLAVALFARAFPGAALLSAQVPNPDALYRHRENLALAEPLGPRQERLEGRRRSLDLAVVSGGSRRSADSVLIESLARLLPQASGQDHPLQQGWRRVGGLAVLLEHDVGDVVRRVEADEVQ